MTTTDPERWGREQGRLRAEVGEEIFLSWFARMELDRIHETTANLTVATRFHQSWIQ